jgi:polyferredoxin
MASLRFNLSLGQYQLGLYVLGILGAVGSLVGKIPCGWLCPFGLMQELLYKIPIRKFRIPTFLTYLKYVFLAATVFALPFFLVDEFGYGETWFCKWICPAGTLEAGLPLVALNAGIRGQIGLLFSWKVALLAFFLVWMIFSARPFCRTTCPLGAILGLFNKASLFRMVVDDERCTQCNDCQKKCPVENAVYKKPDSPDCIRCLSCVKNCQFGAASYEFLRKRSAKAKEPA